MCIDKQSESRNEEKASTWSRSVMDMSNKLYINFAKKYTFTAVLFQTKVDLSITLYVCWCKQMKPCACAKIGVKCHESRAIQETLQLETQLSIMHRYMYINLTQIW